MDSNTTGELVLAIRSNLPDGALHCFLMLATAYGCASMQPWIRWIQWHGHGCGRSATGGVYAVDGSSPSDAYAVRGRQRGHALVGPTVAPTPPRIFTARDPRPDGGFILGGFQVLPGNDYEMLLLKLDSAGNRSGRSTTAVPGDNAAFVEVLPQGGTSWPEGAAERYSTEAPALYRLDDQGTGYGRSYMMKSGPKCLVHRACPHGGTAVRRGPVSNSWLADAWPVAAYVRTAWAACCGSGRTSTNAVRDHYITDPRRTLDGGFIVAGTAWDSLLVSQDAW